MGAAERLPQGALGRQAVGKAANNLIERGTHVNVTYENVDELIKTGAVKRELDRYGNEVLSAMIGKDYRKGKHFIIVQFIKRDEERKAMDHVSFAVLESVTTVDKRDKDQENISFQHPTKGEANAVLKDFIKQLASLEKDRLEEVAAAIAN